MKKVFDFLKQIHPKIVSPYENLDLRSDGQLFSLFWNKYYIFVDISHPPTISSKPSYQIYDTGSSGFPQDLQMLESQLFPIGTYKLFIC